MDETAGWAPYAIHLLFFLCAYFFLFFSMAFHKHCSMFQCSYFVCICFSFNVHRTDEGRYVSTQTLPLMLLMLSPALDFSNIEKKRANGENNISKKILGRRFIFDGAMACIRALTVSPCLSMYHLLEASLRAYIDLLFWSQTMPHIAKPDSRDFIVVCVLAIWRMRMTLTYTHRIELNLKEWKALAVEQQTQREKLVIGKMKLALHTYKHITKWKQLQSERWLNGENWKFANVNASTTTARHNSSLFRCNGAHERFEDVLINSAMPQEKNWANLFMFLAENLNC